MLPNQTQEKMQEKQRKGIPKAPTGIDSFDDIANGDWAASCTTLVVGGYR